MPGISTPKKIAQCVRCREPADKACTRCDDLYCSAECQNADWPSHRYICFKMASLRIAGEEGDVKSAAGSTATSERENRTHKAVSIIETKAEPVKKENAPAPCAPVKSAPVVVTQVASEQKPAILIKIEAQKAEVEASKTVESAAPVASSGPSKFALRRHFAKPAPKKTMVSDLTFREFNITNSKAKVTLVGFLDESVATQLIFCDEKNTEEFQAIAGHIQEYCKDKTPGYDPIDEEVVLCKFDHDDMWYRACVDGGRKANGTYDVVYLEYCNREIVTCDKIMKLPDELKFDVLSKVFDVKNAPKLVEMLNEKQAEILNGSFMITDIVENDGDIGTECNIFGF